VYAALPLSATTGVQGTWAREQSFVRNSRGTDCPLYSVLHFRHYSVDAVADIFGKLFKTQLVLFIAATD
jgi:hypothetical protein